jgi:hypothetical protein
MSLLILKWRMTEKLTSWKVASLVTVLIGAAIGGYCGFMGFLLKEKRSSTKVRFELNGAPVQQTSDWSFE